MMAKTMLLEELPPFLINFSKRSRKKMGSIDQVVNIINMENWKIAFFGAGKYANAYDYYRGGY